MKRAVIGFFSYAFLLTMVSLSWSAVTTYEPSANPGLVTFYAHSTGHDFEGTSSAIYGEFGCDRDDFVNTAFGDVRIPVQSLQTGIKARDKNMYKKFEVKKFPLIVFKLEEIQNFTIQDTSTLSCNLVGSLSMHGVSKKVSIPSRVSFSGSKISVSGGIEFAMSDFNIEPPSFLFFKVADTVRIAFTLRGTAEPVSDSK